MTDTMRALVDATERVLKWVDPIVGDNRDLKAAEEETESVKALKDALARSEALLAGREGWKPIAECTGHFVCLVAREPDNKRIYTPTTAFRDATDVWRVFRSKGGMTRLDFEPTRFMPLPPPPTVTMKGEGE